MSKNPGNTGNRGYKMAKVLSVTARDGRVIVSLACGHHRNIAPYPGKTAEEYAAQCQEWVGGRWRCEGPHDVQAQPV